MDAMIFCTLVQDTYAPIKIIHGYGGYKTEYGLRDAFLNFFNSRTTGFGVPSMPNLVSSETFSIAKLTGMPFLHPKLKNGYWDIIASSRSNPIALMIEIIWTKISLACNLNMPWGDDTNADAMAALLRGKHTLDEKTGKEGLMLYPNELSESELIKLKR